MDAHHRHIRMYRRADGVVPFLQWFNGLRDERGQQKILARIDRAKLGNFGDHRSVGEGVGELKIAFGPGYRVYFGREGDEVVILLIGGAKDSQNEDIRQAKAYWADYRERRAHGDR